MPRFMFRVQRDKFPEIPAIEDVLSDRYAARKVALGLCADLAKDIVTGLTEDSEWRLDVLDESGLFSGLGFLRNRWNDSGLRLQLARL
jgi:hypothetical protein